MIVYYLILGIFSVIFSNYIFFLIFNKIMYDEKKHLKSSKLSVFGKKKLYHL